MSNPVVDLNRLAALLDGRVGEQESRELLEQLAASEDLWGAYVDAALITEGLCHTRGREVVLRPARYAWS